MSREDTSRSHELRQLWKDLQNVLDTKEKMAAVWLVATEIMPQYALTEEQEALLGRINGLDDGGKFRIGLYMTRHLIADKIKQKKTKKSSRKRTP